MSDASAQTCTQCGLTEKDLVHHGDELVKLGREKGIDVSEFNCHDFQTATAFAPRTPLQVAYDSLLKGSRRDSENNLVVYLYQAQEVAKTLSEAERTRAESAEKLRDEHFAEIVRARRLFAEQIQLRERAESSLEAAKLENQALKEALRELFDEHRRRNPEPCSACAHSDCEFYRKCEALLEAKSPTKGP